MLRTITQVQAVIKLTLTPLRPASLAFDPHSLMLRSRDLRPRGGLSILIQLLLGGVELVVETFARQQLVMRTGFHDPRALQSHDPVSIPHS